jgi:hypothetical protein
MNLVGLPSQGRGRRDGQDDLAHSERLEDALLVRGPCLHHEAAVWDARQRGFLKAALYLALPGDLNNEGRLDDPRTLPAADLGLWLVSLAELRAVARTREDPSHALGVLTAAMSL